MSQPLSDGDKATLIALSVGSIAFGAWQSSLGAGVWMLVVLVLVCEVSERLKR